MKKLTFWPFTKIFINHRAKRGGSLFQGGSGEGEGSRSDPPHPHHLTPPIPPRGAKPLPFGREATHTVRGGTPPFASFFPISIPKCQQIWMKLGRKHLWSKPNKLIGRFCNAPPGGRAIGGRRCKFDSFADFAWISVITRAPLGGKRPPKEAVGSLDHV